MIPSRDLSGLPGLHRTAVDDALIAGARVREIASRFDLSKSGVATVVAAIVEARKAAGVTQVELAARLSKPQSFISKVERRERRVDVLEFIAIARALGVQPASLLGEIDARLLGEIAL